MGEGCSKGWEEGPHIGHCDILGNLDGEEMASPLACCRSRALIHTGPHTGGGGSCCWGRGETRSRKLPC